MWTLALISLSWILNNLKEKTEDGHCHNINHEHGDVNPRLCPLGSQFHKDLYDECLNSFKEMLQVSKDHPPKVISVDNKNT
jgi:hypothetical protein